MVAKEACCDSSFYPSLMARVKGDLVCPCPTNSDSTKGVESWIGGGDHHWVG